MDKRFASRKFILFLISIIAVALGWFYSLVYKTDLLATISTLWMSMLAAYSGANIVDAKIATKSSDQSVSKTVATPTASSDTKKGE